MASLTEIEQWEMADEIIDRGVAHPALRAVRSEWDQMVAVLEELRASGAGLKRAGAGRTEHPTIVLARLVPALRSLSEVSGLVASQLEERLSR